MKRNTKKTLAIYWQAASQYKFAVAICVTSVIMASILNVIIPLYFKQFFDLLSSGQAKPTVAAGLVSILMIIGVIEFFQWLGWRVATFHASYFQSNVMTGLADYNFKYLHQHSFSFFNNSFVGSLVKKVKWFSKAFESISDRILWNILPLIVNIIVITFVLFRRNTWLGLGILAWVVFFLLVNWAFTRYKLRFDIARSEAETETTSYLADTITNNTTVKLFNGFTRELSGFHQVNKKFAKLRRLTWDLGNIFEAIQGVLIISLEIAVFYLAIKLWQRDILTIGDFVLIQAYLINIFMRVWDFGRIIRDIYENLADAQEMTEILETPHEIQDIVKAQKLVVVNGTIDFEGVDFYYHQTRRVLKKLNLKIKSREHVALIGPSGAGKTTVIRLLMRMHDITAGKILIDNQDIAKVTQESLWSNVGLVPQDPILFHRTLMENIRYGKPDATDQEVMIAAKLSHCHEFIKNLSEGYNTYVGERGIKLSGGERQRVAIARAILRNSPILVLDEATSSLDSESERLIQDALDTLMKGKTVIVIAHRLSTIRKMDRIIVISNGTVAEQGTHTILLKKKSSIYSKLWKLQALGFVP
ncbi:MAG: ABC transporter ATP-binding protein [Patescibacteria group bacterium]|nr:ABC transporter ATP-binding protein [Patescibacteria group bacterium]